MIGITNSNGGGGGGGAGTVTSVATLSDSLKDNTAPNPIVGAGTIDFEVQIISQTIAQLQTLQATNKLLEGVTYLVNDFSKTIGGVNVKAACFKAVKGTSGEIKLSQKGQAIDGSNVYEIIYDLGSNELIEAYYAPTNIRATKTPGSLRNCIAATRFLDGNWLGSTVNDVDLLNAVNGTTFYGCYAKDCSIDFVQPGNAISNCRIFGNVAFQLTTPVTIENCYFGIGSTISADADMLDIEVGISSSFGTSPGKAATDCRIGVGQIISTFNYAAGNTFTADTNNHSPIQKFVAAAIAEQIASSPHSQIFVNIDPTAHAVGYSINLPQYPIDRQIVNIGWNAACATGTGIVTATFAAGITVPLLASQKGQCISYYYDAASLFWYLV